MVTPQTLKGFRDFLPEEKKKRDYVLRKVIEVFELYRFQPLETPTLEYASLLLGKYGEEADKLVYSFEDKGGRKVALRYDQTVPTARVLAAYRNNLPRYFRRYQTQNVFRADKPQKGRFREFTQCDIDIFGSTSPLSDAEILACTYAAFMNVGYPSVTLNINDRQVLFTTLQPFATDNVSVLSCIQSVDKLDKIGREGVTQELVTKGLSQDSATQCVAAILAAKPTANLQEIMAAAWNLGIPRSQLVFNPAIARGLDYYTGMIFEVTVDGYMVGSLGGGGRYDHLIEQLGGVDIPAVGIAFGFDRMVEAAEQFGLVDKGNQQVSILTTIFDSTTQANALQTAIKLRSAGFVVEVYPQLEKLAKQMKYASDNGFNYAIIIGADELANKVIAVKNLKTGEQQQIPNESIIEFFAAAE